MKMIRVPDFVFAFGYGLAMESVSYEFIVRVEHYTYRLHDVEEFRRMLVSMSELDGLIPSVTVRMTVESEMFHELLFDKNYIYNQNLNFLL